MGLWEGGWGWDCWDSEGWGGSMWEFEFCLEIIFFWQYTHVDCSYFVSHVQSPFRNIIVRSFTIVIFYFKPKQICSSVVDSFVEN